uniref:N-terminal Ras-GEF domain-containing protein n=1 Tax=Mus musculus TaxID=10090 RepID=Q3V0R1_MOUSE|nr:unnamed protein product [Mus musculus]
MSSWCLRTTRGLGLKKENREGHGSVWRHRVHSCLQRLWPFSRKGKTVTKGKQDQNHTDQDLREPRRESPISAEMVVKLVNNLVPSLQEGDHFFVSIFLSTYRSFVTPLQVLGLLFMRYPYFHPHSVEHRQVRSSLCNFLHTWMDKNPEDFCDPSDMLPLTYLKAYLSVHMPHSELFIRVDRLLNELWEEQDKDSHAKNEEDSDLGRHTSSDPELKRCK